MKKIRMIVKLLLFIFILKAVFLKDSLISMASVPEGRNMVKVGLTKEYFNKISLRLNNSTIKIGFSKDDIYYPFDILRGEDGISISRDYGVYKIYGGSFTTYAKAASEAAALRGAKKSLTVIPALVGMNKNGKGVWKLYDVYSAENILTENDLYAEVNDRKSKYLLAVSIGKDKLIVDAGKAGANPQFEPVNKDEGVEIEGENRYRGRIEVGTYGKKGVTAVNIINLEDYIRGSVPMEMTYTWHSSALKAQAVCARSFGAAVSGFGSDSDISKGYRLTNTISHQSYGGMNVETKETDRAVKSTESEFVTYKNKVIKTTYFSTSGGYTEDSENVWGAKKPWLRAVPDPYENKPEKKPWTLVFTKQELSNMLSGYKLSKGKRLGVVKSIRVTKRSKSGRVLELVVRGSAGSLILKKQEIRKAFNLYSTKIKVYTSSAFVNSLSTGSKKVNKDGFVFFGKGYGHGVGMSQSGARGMAEAGYGYKKIIMHYFTGVEIH